ncbi:MAG TPA: phosphatase PAP2-related protein [Tepidisphaeraceae bacterium]|jgi:hypothetical protein
MTIHFYWLMVTSVPGIRVMVIIASLALWYWSQFLLSRRTPVAVTTETSLADGVHQLSSRINRRLLDNPRQADALLIASSLVIDALGIYLLCSSIFGPTIEPFLGLLILFALRQICQMFCPLPPPVGMIWRRPGFPALLVTYGTSNDLFFSGHTAIAVYGAAVLAATLGPVGIVLGTAIAVFEMGAVLCLRAHYTMDVFAGAITALYVHRLAIEWAPVIDKWIAHAMTSVR